MSDTGEGDEGGGLVCARIRKSNEILNDEDNRPIALRKKPRLSVASLRRGAHGPHGGMRNLSSEMDNEVENTDDESVYEYPLGPTKKMKQTLLVTIHGHQMQQNRRAVESRTSNYARMVPTPPKVQKPSRNQKMIEEKCAALCEDAETRLRERSDEVRKLVQALVRPQFSPWYDLCGLSCGLAEILGIQVVDWCQSTNVCVTMRYYPLEVLASKNFVVPKMHYFAPVMRSILEKASEIGRVPFETNVEVPLHGEVYHPGLQSVDRYLKPILENVKSCARKIIWPLFISRHCPKEDDKTDVRDSVAEWMLDNLCAVEDHKEFWKILKEEVDRGMNERKVFYNETLASIEAQASIAKPTSKSDSSGNTSEASAAKPTSGNTSEDENGNDNTSDDGNRENNTSDDGNGNKESDSELETEPTAFDPTNLAQWYPPNVFNSFSQEQKNLIRKAQRAKRQENEKETVGPTCFDPDNLTQWYPPHIYKLFTPAQKKRIRKAQWEKRKALKAQAERPHNNDSEEENSNKDMYENSGKDNKESEDESSEVEGNKELEDGESAKEDANNDANEPADNDANEPADNEANEPANEDGDEELAADSKEDSENKDSEDGNDEDGNDEDGNDEVAADSKEDSEDKDSNDKDLNMEIKSLTTEAKKLSMLKEDVVLMSLVDAFGEEMRRSGRSDLYVSALNGIVKGATYSKKEKNSIVGIYFDHVGRPTAPNTGFPPINTGSSFFPPGDDFVKASLMAVQLMELLLNTCEMHGIGPPRWRWETMVMDQLRAAMERRRLNGELPMTLTAELRVIALFVTLIYSPATPDSVCIKAMINIFEHGLLSWEKLSECNPDELWKITSDAGMKERNRQLVAIAKDIVHNHEGRLPDDYNVLTSWDGVGRKTAVLTINEIFGVPTGIGVDRHVIEVSVALGFYTYPLYKQPAKADAMDVESSLLKWVKEDLCSRVNRIFGGMAQLTTQRFPRDVKGVNEKMVSAFVLAVSDHLHKPYHVETVWFIFTRIRRQYWSSHKQNKKHSKNRWEDI